MVIYSRLSAAGHKPNPAGSGDQNVNPRAQTESGYMRAAVSVSPAEP